MKHRDTFQKFAKYAAIGILSLALYVTLLSVFVRGFQAPVFIGNLAAYAIATVFNFCGNYLWVFQSRQSAVGAGSKFSALVVLGMVLNAALVPQLVTWGVTAEFAGLIFALFWPLISFASLNFWALR